MACHQLSSCNKWSFLINMKRVQPVHTPKIFMWSRKSYLHDGPCRAQANNRYFKFLLPLPVFSATTGLSLDAWTWLHYMHKLISQCWKLLEFHSFTPQTAFDPLSFSNTSQLQSCIFIAHLFIGEAGGGRSHLQVGSHFSNTEG